MFNKNLEDNHMEQLEKIAKKYNLRYENCPDLVGYETGEILFGQNDSGYWHPWLTRTGQSISISTDPLLRLTNSNPDINIESALEFITENKWAKNYNYHFPKRILIPFYEWEKIKKKSENNLKVELGNIIITKKLVEQMDNPDYREEVIKCISDYKHCRWGTPDEEKKQDNDWAVYYGADIRDQFETSHGKIEIESLMDRSNTFIALL